MESGQVGISLNEFAIMHELKCDFNSVGLALLSLILFANCNFVPYHFLGPACSVELG